ncbi:MAG: crotonase/enoyl-CoA hydratase family protein [Deltaproteobacteria bacterium]|nr:crotonase/enoyl-CoA hydratase family protein [Deltaproteobacteria bacterium]
MDAVRVETSGPVTTVILSRPGRRNAIDRATADALVEAFVAFAADGAARVAVLWGEGGSFCAGADLKAIAEGQPNRVEPGEPGPLGPTRTTMPKPVIAAIEGHAVAGGLELALWCDLRVAARDAVLGVFCRRWGVPLIDGGTARLPRVVGLGRALDLVLTGRAVAAEEALAMGLVNRVVEPGGAREEAEKLAAEIAMFPQGCMLADRASVYAAFAPGMEEALLAEHHGGVAALAAEGVGGAARFAARR